MRRFEDDIQALVDDTVDMCGIACGMIEKSVFAICECNPEAAEEVVRDFDRVDRYDDSIEADAVRILTLYQPTAVDARTVSTVMKCITYIERIAKYSKNIANATLYLADKPMYEPVELIGPMGEVAVRMVKLAAGCFENGSVEGLDKIVEMDDYLDRTMRRDLADTIGFITANPESADVCTYYISVLKYLERVGDHACKMAEKITFMVTGDHRTYE